MGGWMGQELVVHPPHGDAGAAREIEQPVGAVGSGKHHRSQKSAVDLSDEH